MARYLSIIDGAGVTISSGLTATSTSGSGGTININANSGTLSLPSGTFSTSGNQSGGSIILQGASISVASGGNLALAANITGGGENGATVKITTTTGSLNIGNGNGQISIASGGGTYPYNYNSQITIVSAANLTVDGSALSLTPGAGGYGALVSLSASGSNLTVNNTVNVSGGAGGNGGKIDIEAPYNAAATTITINGPLTANSGSTSGYGGTIYIANNIYNNPGGIVFGNAANISAAGQQGGGNIQFYSSYGAVSIPGGTISTSTLGTSGQAGSISINASPLQIGTGTLLTLNANSAGSSQGGSITVYSSGNTSDLQIGSGGSGQPGQMTINAQGGTTGNGGYIYVYAGRNLTVAASSLSFNTAAAGTSGNGGNLTLEAGYSTSGNLVITGNLAANGVGSSGNGGSITLESSSTSPFIVDTTNPANGTTGTIQAQANASATSGSGGTIDIQNSGTGGITLSTLSNISVQSFGGYGGTITLNAYDYSSSGPLALGTGTLSVSASGSNNNQGGTINLSGSTLTITGGGALTLTSNRAGNSNGGRINVNTYAATSNLVIGSSANDLILNANGGTGSGTGTTGGTIDIAAGGNLTVAPGSISLTPGTNGGGGTITLQAGNYNNAGQSSNKRHLVCQRQWYWNWRQHYIVFVQRCGVCSRCLQFADQWRSRKYNCHWC